MKLYNKFLSVSPLLVAALLLFGAGGVAQAECIGDPQATGILLVDGNTECENIGQTGCMISGDTGNCMLPNSGGMTVYIEEAIPGDKNSGITWSSNNGTVGVNTLLIGGATNGGACATIYDPGVKKPSDPGVVFGYVKNNGSIASVNYVWVCSKYENPPAALRLTNRVVAEDPDTHTYDCTQAVAYLAQEINEQTGFKYCYTIKNEGGAAYNSVTLSDDMGTPGDFSDDLSQNLGPLAVNGTIEFTSPAPITFSDPTTVVNTANVSGTDVNGEYAEDDDSATLVISVAPVECDVVQVVDSNGNTLYNFLSFTGFDPLKPNKPAKCVRTGDATTFPRARRSHCIDECVLKPECIPPNNGSTAPGGICEQPCLPSQAWTEHDSAANAYACIGPAENVPSNVYPYCWEVQQDLNRDCILNAVHPMPSQETTGVQTSTNPYVYKSCTKQGGRRTCDVYCYLYDGEDASACPDTSIVVEPTQ